MLHQTKFAAQSTVETSDWTLRLVMYYVPSLWSLRTGVRTLCVITDRLVLITIQAENQEILDVNMYMNSMSVCFSIPFRETLPGSIDSSII